ncbi:MAG: Uma2 family endonuclease [Catalinimonas sp.]
MAATTDTWTPARADAELPPEVVLREIIDGKLIMSPAPIPAHQESMARTSEALRAHVRTPRLGIVLPAPLDVVLSDEDVVRPDVIYVAQGNHILNLKNITGAPDLLVEIVSAGSVCRDRIDKKALYERHGVREHWPAELGNRAVEVCELREGSYQLLNLFTEEETLCSDVLPGFTVPVADLLPPADWLEEVAE